MSNYWMRKAASRRGVLRSTALGAAGLAASVAVGCGDDDSGGSKPATSAASVAATAAGSAAPGGATAAAKPSPKPGGTLTYVTSVGDPPTFDVNTVTGNLTRIPAGFVYSRLLGHKSGPGINYQAPPIDTDLASSYEVADNGLTITFKLRQGVKFQAPVSREMKAADVLYSYQRYVGQLPPTKAAPNASRFVNYIDSVTAPDDYTVVVKAKKPYFPLVDAFASASYLFVYPTEAGTAFDPTTKMVGTGPFTMESFRPGQGMTFAPFRDWFRAKERPVYVDKVELPFLAVEQRQTQFLAKNVDAVTAVAGATLVQIRKQMPDVQYWGSPVGASSLAFSVKDTRLKDQRVRQALSMALDRDGINDTLFGLTELKAAGLQAETAWMNFVSPRNKDEFLDPKGKEISPANAKLFVQNIADAKKLLSAAGFPNGFEMKVAITPAYGQPYATETEIIAQMFTQIGVKTTVDTQDYASQYIKTYLGDFDSGAVMLSDGQSDPADYIELWFGSTSVRNASRVNDPEVDRQLADIQGTFNAQERTKKLKDMQQYLDDKMYNVPCQSSGGSTWIVAQPSIGNARDYAASPSPYGYGWPSDGLPYWFKNA